ncbi:ABC-F family ATP-binding cassette domain-containing protein [Nonomuraea rhodomycinica]|uniref:ABC-F family ATP-binding cassette domain-containing protein n=1 Tax=Nonomuraea rhodomycinica TaxID=1712872 RepID=A0A7Y6II71_9ACTN|nr:ATP-binding cassette domain-containing protein [Nonomuraea rhodomycinica]NUW38621.1 ABC-F family ATP-binding cassette domain-containing protein [Nonomuraea rhodomycinica]
MSHIDVRELTYLLPDGRPLLENVSFKIGSGAKAALVGPNGAGKTTLLRLVSGELRPASGRVAVTGGIGVMPQFLAPGTVADLLLAVAPPQVRRSAAALTRAESAIAARDDEDTQLAYAQAIADHADAGGYELEVVWDVCAQLALGRPYEQVRERPLDTLSGGEQKRLMLQALLRGPDRVLLLDEPDNYLDVPAKQWLERELRGTTKTVLLVSHDRRLLAETADRLVTVEDRGVWVHGGGFASYAQARRDRAERLGELRRRWEEERARLRGTVHTLRQRAARNDALSGAYQAARTRLERFEQAGPPRRAPRPQNVRMRLSGGRTGKRALTCAGLRLTGLSHAFDAEVWYGERVGVLGLNGTGKSHFLRLLAGEPVAHTGRVSLGARVRPGLFAQTHTRPDLRGRTVAGIVMTDHRLERNDAMAALARYELAPAWSQDFATLSGGQQARLQILLLELSGATMLLLDEPTDNLDLASAEALQEGLAAYRGTVLAVTHDRWFAAAFDRYLIFTAVGAVLESDEPRWDL